ncbi:unnamed protein product [Zymoseptoria tritici ST99CH_1A5]|uniref:Mitotic checkpoint regulator, MAD2B-interacting-domain-containing protein n=4 Tax=Zymoseptoria tritici TaxID=1047171 RepID=F9X5L6_ZYMTI|nr:uncharacterized protein MYCGRDRAFT_91519 [Zymoseptoria tritici IPO323]SMQ48596.1 unnamed protein product [Zymoseptoria tritici ST99CH_3D7]SMR48381.1 unnamed protein product [Zymoseptoria tritici ST99CH_1E4]SMR49593.1 unnamed protein product [Zymoseptoria tritici ST99CH_3D1]SMY22290.1 unnamed protein product [Zymoseptoria tritici ST99CH_1A5]EGP88703.1 hypothetical protein MYCGRDRAFT_91519 [Zymoseptoria tritici IPO323]
MALVEYSDSESDTEVSAAAPKAVPASKPAFQKLATAPGKIKVDLPSIRPEPGQKGDGASDEPPTKRARTGGGFSGINSFLPAPKRTAQNAPKKGVSLKTSSEAAFSRERPPMPTYGDSDTSPIGENVDVPVQGKKDEVAAEPKLIGKATRFLPLSVSSKKKKKSVPKPAPKQEGTLEKQTSDSITSPDSLKQPELAAPAPKPKRSLFSMQPEDEPAVPATFTSTTYEPLITQEQEDLETSNLAEQPTQPPLQQLPTPSLEAVASDLNLTPAQRRQLFGRGGKDVNITHFNMDSEYASNEQMRQAGEVVEHRAIKTIAPGKHSLQQLVNNARTQKDAMEDKWAEGKKNRGEGASKYGWG